MKEFFSIEKHKRIRYRYSCMNAVIQISSLRTHLIVIPFEI